MNTGYAEKNYEDFFRMIKDRVVSDYYYDKL